MAFVQRNELLEFAQIVTMIHVNMPPLHAAFSKHKIRVVISQTMGAVIVLKIVAYLFQGPRMTCGFKKLNPHAGILRTEHVSCSLKS